METQSILNVIGYLTGLLDALTRTNDEDAIVVVKGKILKYVNML